MLIDSMNFLKNFYFVHKKFLTNTLIDKFDKLNFIKFVGKDIYRRQIFLIGLDKLDFNALEKELNALLIYSINCNENRFLIK